MMKIMCQYAVTEPVIGLKHSVSGHGYKGYKSQDRQKFLQNKDFNKLNYKSSYSCASMQLESPKRRKNVILPPYKIHGNSKNITEIPK